MTIGEVKETIRKTYVADNGKEITMFRPCCDKSFIEFETAQLQKAFNEIIKKIELAQIGLYSFSEGEKILYQLFLEHAKYGA